MPIGAQNRRWGGRPRGRTRGQGLHDSDPAGVSQHTGGWDVTNGWGW